MSSQSPSAKPDRTVPAASDHLRLQQIGERLRSVFDTPAASRSPDFDEALKRLEQRERY